MANERPDWDQYFLEIMNAVSKRSTCDRARSSCVVAKDKRILATGYSGSPSGLPHCDDVGHELGSVVNADGSQSSHCIRTTHAELNAIVHAARVGTSLDGGTLYCNMTPCYTCAKAIVNAGIVRVVAKQDYHAGTSSKEIFRQAGIDFSIVDPSISEYANQ